MQTPKKIELLLVGAALPGRNSTTCSTQACVFYFIFIYFIYWFYITYFIRHANIQKTRFRVGWGSIARQELHNLQYTSTCKHTRIHITWVERTVHVVLQAIKAVRLWLWTKALLVPSQQLLPLTGPSGTCHSLVTETFPPDGPKTVVSIKGASQLAQCVPYPQNLVRGRPAVQAKANCSPPLLDVAGNSQSSWIGWHSIVPWAPWLLSLRPPVLGSPLSQWRCCTRKASRAVHDAGWTAKQGRENRSGGVIGCVGV